MGYRLHYAQHYAPEWKGGYFNWESDQFAELVYSEFSDNYYMNDENTEIELERADIERYIKKLLKRPSEINKYFPSTSGEVGYTNREVAEAFQEILQSDDNLIHMEWF